MTASKRRKRKRGRSVLAQLRLPSPAAKRHGGGVLAQLRLPSPPAKRRASGVLGAVKRPSWKVVGLAGVAGVAATGVVVARNRRAQAALEPDELRERLRGRLAEVDADSPGGQGAGSAGSGDSEPPSGDTPV